MKTKFKKALERALIKDSVKIYVLKVFAIAFFISFFLGFITFTVIASVSGNMLIPLIILLLSFLLIIIAGFSYPKIIFDRLKKEVDSDLVLVARRLNLRLQAGDSLLRALEEASTLQTTSARYMRKIVTNIYEGISIEYAIQNVMFISPSKKFSTVLNEILNALNTGVDLEKALQTTVQELIQEKMYEVKEYGKRLGPLTMFYLIFGTILPALGSSLLLIAVSFVNPSIDFVRTALIILIIVIFMVQVFFYMLLTSNKPVSVI